MPLPCQGPVSSRDRHYVQLRAILRWCKYASGAGAVLVLGLLALKWSSAGAEATPLLVADALATVDVERHAARHGPAADWRRLASAPSELLEVDNHHCGAHHESNQSSLESTLAFLFFCFLLTNLLDHVNLIVPFALRFPLSVVLFIFGMLVGAFFLHGIGNQERWMGNGFDELIYGVTSAAQFDPHALLYIILPPLLYESASSMQWHVLRKVLPSAVILAVPGVCLNTFFTGVFVRVAFQVSGSRPSWSASYLLASILSATDPVAVVAALSALGAPAKLSTLVEGESLLNDGSAVVIAYVMRDWTMDSSGDQYKQCLGSPPDPGCVMGYFCQVALGGCAIGVAASGVLYCWMTLARTRHQTALELAIVLVSVYATFFVAEGLHTSGVLAVVTLGIAASANIKARMSHEGRHAHHVVLEQISYVCNQLIFFTAGIISTRFMWNDTGCDHDYSMGRAWLELFALYIVIHITRGAVVMLFLPLLSRLGYGVSWKEASILVFGGLRGAVGLVVSLVVEHNEHIDGGVKQMIAFHTSGIVLLTLCLNGSTVDDLYKRLNIYPANPFRVTHLRKVLHQVEGDCQSRFSTHWFFKDAKLKQIMRCMPNFRHIQFNSSGQPYPVGIATVMEALVGLEEDIQRIKQAKQMAHSDSRYDRFNTRWAKRKEDIEMRFMQLIDKNCTSCVDRRDQVVGVSNSGNGEIDFRPQETNTKEGFYVSSRSVADLLKEHAYEDSKEIPGFRVKVMKCTNVRITVGLLADIQEVRQIKAPHDGSVLGISENSIGLDCTECTVLFRGSEESRCVCISGGPVLVTQGDMVCLDVIRSPGREWEVRIAIVTDGIKKCENSFSFGPFSPEECFPAVEFHVNDGDTRPSGQGVHAAAASLVTNSIGLAAYGLKSTGGVAMATVQKAAGLMARRTSVISNASGHLSLPDKADTQASIEFSSQSPRTSPRREPSSPKCLSRSRDRDKPLESSASKISHDTTLSATGSFRAPPMLKELKIGRGSKSPPLGKEISGEVTSPPPGVEEEEAMPKELGPALGESSKGLDCSLALNVPEKTCSSRTLQTIPPSISDAKLPSGAISPLSAWGTGTVRATPEPQDATASPPPHILDGPRSATASCTLSEGKGHDSEDEVAGSPSGRGIAKSHSRKRQGEKQYATAKVMLNFETRLASDHESINELFHVLFNTVKNHYQEMHEQGILSDQALHWLSESVGEAMDSANEEVNSMRAADFLNAANHRSSGGVMSPHLFADIAWASPTKASSTIQTVNNLFKDKSRHGLLGLFEPLAVEYLSLEQSIARTSVWDTIGHQKRWLKFLAYSGTRSKVEALWAFVEAHENFIQQSTAMTRFPALQSCLERVLEEAKNDLRIIADISPRAFFYAKHALALRILLVKRLKKLKAVVGAGWISSGDAEKLTESLLERIVEAEEFFPRKRGILYYSRSGSTIPDEAEQNAWDDFEFEVS